MPAKIMLICSTFLFSACGSNPQFNAAGATEASGQTIVRFRGSWVEASSTPGACVKNKTIDYDRRSKIVSRKSVCANDAAGTNLLTPELLTLTDEDASKIHDKLDLLDLEKINEVYGSKSEAESSDGVLLTVDFDTDKTSKLISIGVTDENKLPSSLVYFWRGSLSLTFP